MLKIQNLIEDVKCFETGRSLRWPDGVTCPHCASSQVIKKGHDDSQPARQRYECSACQRRFDDLTGTIFAGHHKPRRAGILGWYFRGLNLSKEQRAHELDLNPDDALEMTSQLRDGLVERKPEVTLTGEVECDEVYVVAGHQGHPEAVKKRPRGTPPPIEGDARSRNAGEGEAADLRHDPAHRRGHDPHAGERATGDDRSTHQADDCRRPCGVQ